MELAAFPTLRKWDHTPGLKLTSSQGCKSPMTEEVVVLVLVLVHEASCLLDPHPKGDAVLNALVVFSGRSSMLGEKTETIMMQRLTEKGQNVAAAAAPGRELNRSAKSTRTGRVGYGNW